MWLSRTVWGLLGTESPSPYVLRLPLVYRKALASQAFPEFSKSKFNQRCKKRQKERKIVKQDKITIAYPFTKPRAFVHPQGQYMIL